MTAVEIGEVVTLTEVDSEPALLVLEIDDDITGALLADVAHETIERIEATIGDREGRRTIARAVHTADDICTFQIPPAELAHREGPGIQGCGPVEGGGE